MIHPKRERADSALAEAAADLTPMLDVLFILLVFFVLTANTAQVVLDLKLPQEQSRVTKAAPDGDRIVIGVHKPDGQGGGWTVKGHRFTDWETAKAAIKAAHETAPKAVFVVAGDREAQVAAFLKTLSFLRQIGLKQTNILMEPK